VLLPQVATSRGWDVKEFLRHTCLKAGLREDDWESGAEISTFSAEVFGDEVTTVLAPGYLAKAEPRG
jgi:AMMECR1 domain-containing protein